MLNGLESGLQRRFECHGPYEMFQELKLIFQANARVEIYEVSLLQDAANATLRSETLPAQPLDSQSDMQATQLAQGMKGHLPDKSPAREI